MSRPGNRFAKGSGVYACLDCGKLTRSTGRGDNDNVRLCAACYDKAGEMNAHADGHHVETPSRDCPECAAAKGGQS